MQQYWAGNPDAYEFVGVSQLAEAFQRSGISSEVDGEEDLEKGKKKQESSADKGKGGRDLDPLVHEKYDALLLDVLSCCLFDFSVDMISINKICRQRLMIRPNQQIVYWAARHDTWL